MNSPSFAQLVSLACHDLRTPLATVHGFAATLERAELPQPESRYVEMIRSASEQLGGLIEDLSVAARIEGGRYEPLLAEVDLLELAREAGEAIEPVAVASGRGELVRVEATAARRALRSLASCALRHGGVDRVELHVDGAQLELEPVTEEAGPILLGESLRDLGAAIAVRVIRSFGGSVELVGGRLVVRFRAAP